MAKPPFPWIGSKEKIAPYILQLFPPKLTQYVERSAAAAQCCWLCRRTQTDWTFITTWMPSW